MLIPKEHFVKVYNSYYGQKKYKIKIKKHLEKEFDVKLGPNYVYNTANRLKKQGDMPLDSGNQIGQGEILKGTSTMYDAEGNIKLQWVKTKVNEQDYLKSVEDYILNLTNGLNVQYKPVKPPSFTNSDLTTFYPLPDLHFGLLTHGEELNHGLNFDMKIQTEWVLGAMQHMVETSPASKYAVVVDLGDFLHAMDDKKQTKSGHHLDVDGRHHKIVESAFDIMKDLIYMALAKHEFVYFYSVSGNHSEEASIYLRSFINAFFKDEPRVIVHKSNKAQQYHVFGKNILGFTHGHELRPSNAGQCLVYDNQEIFSNSLYRHFHFGHYHHDKIHGDETLCKVEIHKNIIPRDKWADSMGFRGVIGDTKAIYYHRDFGEIGRSRFNINMLNNPSIQPTIESQSNESTE